MSEVVLTREYKGSEASRLEVVLPISKARILIAIGADLDRDEVGRNLERVAAGDEDVRTVYSSKRLEMKWSVAPLKRVFRVRTEVVDDVSLEVKREHSLYDFEEGVALLAKYLNVGAHSVRAMVLASESGNKWSAPYGDYNGMGGIRFEYSVTG